MPTDADTPVVVSSLRGIPWRREPFRLLAAFTAAMIAAMAALIGLSVTALFSLPVILLRAPTKDDWLTIGCVLAACTAYFGAGLHTFRKLGGLEPRGAMQEDRVYSWRLVRTAATDTLLGLVAIGWTGLFAAFLQFLLIIGPVTRGTPRSPSA